MREVTPSAVGPTRRLVTAGSLGAAVVALAGCGIRLEDDAPRVPLVPTREPIPAEDALVRLLGAVQAASVASLVTTDRLAPLLPPLHARQATVLHDALRQRGVPESALPTPTPSPTASATPAGTPGTATPGGTPAPGASAAPVRPRRTVTEVESTVLQLVTVIALVAAGGLIVVLIVGTAIVRYALRPLDRVVATATHVAELPLDRGEVALSVRVPEEDAQPSTEVGTVGAAINHMLGNIANALSAREASERKVRTFVADASHELPDDVVRAMGRIESESVRMTSLVEDLLLLARLDDGRELESAPVDLVSLLADAVSDAQAAGPDHSWTLDTPDEPVVVPGDAPRLHQVLVNLLGNARTHTPAGTSVTASIRSDGDRAVIAVSDDGPGIAEDLQPTMFERFVRGDSSRSRAAGSTGLGLAIVAAVVEAHGGAVGVASQPGSTTFTVSLPMLERV